MFGGGADVFGVGVASMTARGGGGKGVLDNGGLDNGGLERRLGRELRVGGGGMHLLVRKARTKSCVMCYASGTNCVVLSVGVLVPGELLGATTVAAGVCTRGERGAG
eukprot:1881452-Rhodomonas_salina.2